MFKIEGNKVLRAEDGKLVAEFADNKLMFAQGMAQPYKKKLLAWMVENNINIQGVAAVVSDEDKPKAVTLPASAPEGAEKQAAPIKLDASAEPPFDKMFGFKTPGFQEWADKHTQNEINEFLKSKGAF